MGKPVPIPEPEPGLLDPLKDAFLFQDVALAGFCTANAMSIHKDSINFFYGAAMMVVVCYGGSTIATVMCGNPVAFVTNEALVTTCLMTWVAVYTLPGLVKGFVQKTALGRVLLSVCYEIMRTHVMINCSKMAAATLSATLGRPPIISVLIAGMLGGCGGGFMPLDKGLAPLEKGTNWRILSGGIGSIWLWAGIVNPTTKTFLTGLLPFLSNAEWVRFIAIAFNVTVPLLTFAGVPNPFGANPLVPTAAPAASSSKKKQ